MGFDQFMVRPPHRRPKGGIMRKWEAPAFSEIRMDAEINGYQEDRDDIPDLGQEPHAPGIAAAQQERPAAAT